MIQSHDVTNNSSRDMTQTFDISKTIVCSYTFGFSKTTSVFAKLSVSADIALPGWKSNVKAETGLDVSVTDNQEWTTTTTDTFSIKQVVTIPSFRRVTFDGIIEMAENVRMDFVAQILVSMSSIRLTKYTQTLVKQSLPRWQIKNYLLNHVDGRIIQDTEDGVLFETNGTLQGTFGVETLLHAKEFPI
jgi:hypothetical protein